MSMGRRQREAQEEFWVVAAELPRSPGHPFYERLNELLDESGFDPFCEQTCEKFFADKMGRPSIPPGVYFRMLMVGHFEKLDSERQIAWRCSDSNSLRAFLRLRADEDVPDHSSLSRTRTRMDLETHQLIFEWVVKRVAEHGLLKGKTLGVDATTMEANAAMRSIVRKDTGESYKDFITGSGQGFGDRDADGRGGGEVRPRAQGQEGQQRGMAQSV